MSADKAIINYYTILECERTASTEEVKKNYQRLVLCSHPDKNSESKKHVFSVIQEAWTVLRDPEKRKEYDAVLSCSEHSDLLLYDTITLKEMNYNSDGVYTYSCRCGGTYCLGESNSSLPNVIIGCDECSFSIQVNQ